MEKFSLMILDVRDDKRSVDEQLAEIRREYKKLYREYRILEGKLRDSELECMSLKQERTLN